MTSESRAGYVCALYLFLYRRDSGTDSKRIPVDIEMVTGCLMLMGRGQTVRGHKKLGLDSLLGAEKARLVREIREAERECAVARGRFEEAVEFDQVDYAVYSLEAAEKKLDILIRKAKLLWGQENVGERPARVEWAEWGTYR